MTLAPKRLHTRSGKDQIPEIRPHLAPVHIGLVRSLVLSGSGGGLQSLRSIVLHINTNMGISEAYGRAIGTNFGFSSIAQRPPPEPELPLPKGEVELWPGRGARGQSLGSLLFVPLARPC